ncbi:DUF885 domain-containing protein [Sphingomonas sp.]|uniref:DUF885 domain-containing protein n=1 Tax=Sphingomonas sp. TaxID=28214 RepID=UPI003CC526BA
MLTRRAVLAATTATVAAAAVPAFAAGDDPTVALDAIAERFLQDYPAQASELGVDTGARAALRGRLADRSPAGLQAIAGHLRDGLARLERLDPRRLDPAARVHVDVVRTAYTSALEGFAFAYGEVDVGGWRNSPYPVIQNVGAFIDVPRLLTGTQKLDSVGDADAYLARLAGYAAQLEGETERVRLGTAAAAVPPDFLLDKAIAALTLSRGGDPAGWPVVTTLASKFPARAAEAVRLCRERVVPALDRQIAALRDQRARAGSDAGVWRLPQGDAYYRWALAAATTTTRSPDEIHRQGLDELAHYQSEMDAILRPLGYTQGSVGARMTALGRDPRFLFPDNDAGRAQIIAFMQVQIDAIRPKLPGAFAHPVRGQVEVRRIPSAEEPGAAGAYGGAGAIDGSTPGKLWINLRSPGALPRYSLPTLAYHEAIPGHVWQGEYAFRLPVIRNLLSFSAYQEGWALYAEQLADELGMYADAPVDRLGFLQSMAFRAGRLVVDTGLHAKRWTRDQAIRWFAAANGQDPGEVTSEVDRYCSWPGQACAYKVGHSEILRLRAAARGRLHLKAFNDRVVQAGPVPMTVLARIVAA